MPKSIRNEETLNFVERERHLNRTTLPQSPFALVDVENRQNRNFGSLDRKESDVTDFSFVLRLASEDILLYIRNALQDETNREQHHTGNIPPSSKLRLIKMCHVWRVEDGDWK